MLIIALLLAYNEAIHALITRTALPDQVVVQPATQKDIDEFRELFWRKGSSIADFARRFPTLDSFYAWAFKEFLMLNPARRVHGFDFFEEKPLPRRGSFQNWVEVVGGILHFVLRQLNASGAS